MNAKPIEIVYRDAYLVAVNKPAGMMVHRSKLEWRGRQFVLQQLRRQIGYRVYPAHRLDKPTSGVLLFSLKREVARMLAGIFARREVDKTYLAIVRGWLDPEGTIDYPVRRDPSRKRVQNNLKSALTDYRTLAVIELPVAVGRYRTARYSLVAVFPRTGRRHQIRHHMHHISHPIIGDKRHGDNKHNRLFKEKFGCDRMLLAAMELSLTHPVSAEELTITAALDPTFSSMIYWFDWQDVVPSRWLPHHR
jgi:tRNA pseudouridine65 synthase